ncbi:hypothetical protein DDZ18_05550 [Marinicauda salina]|uniref:Diguanylate cyclase n=1 Tax=Marinicauda salina TaxID=2135793 RepID=A0A2U2BT34_9PROT|nr:diguanylate cyclase [Marinicauda salina]PWE17164.1 hypothetical protein DDZ18_05550 [Marinicauda salina]
MGRAADLLIIGAGDAAAEMAADLAGLGFSTHVCNGEALQRALERQRFDAAVSLEAPSVELPERLTHIAVGDHDTPASARLVDPAHPIQIAARLRAVMRLDVLEDTAQARVADVEAAGLTRLETGPGRTESTLLYIGGPDPVFMRLNAAMENAGIEVIAAFTTFNAFDYLHERAFDAVVVNAEPDPDLAHTVCSAMRRNTRLYHTPALLLTNKELYPAADEAFARGASDILHADADPEALCERVAALAEERRRRRRAKATLETCRLSALLDESTGLFEPGFARRHLDTLIARNEERNGSLALVALRAATPVEADDAHADSALVQFASMLRHCVRAEDLAVRADRNAFYLALPATGAEEAETVAARVSAIAECTAYESGDPLKPFRIDVRRAVVERDRNECADALVRRAFAAIGDGGVNRATG